MRRKMLGMSQSTLGEAIGVTFQQVQKYEKGVNRIGSSRLMQAAAVLKVEPSFFFQDTFPKGKVGNLEGVAATAEITAFVATTDGLALARSFTKLRNAKLRRAIVALVEDVAAR
jgi:transcriptional regulator with XRE-family HTH domain